MLNMNLKLSELYGPENPGLGPGNLIFMEPQIVVPAMNEGLDDIRY